MGAIDRKKVLEAIANICTAWCSGVGGTCRVCEATKDAIRALPPFAFDDAAVERALAEHERFCVDSKYSREGRRRNVRAILKAAVEGE